MAKTAASSPPRSTTRMKKADRASSRRCMPIHGRPIGKMSCAGSPLGHQPPEADDETDAAQGGRPAIDGRWTSTEPAGAASASDAQRQQRYGYQQHEGEGGHGNRHWAKASRLAMRPTERRGPGRCRCVAPFRRVHAHVACSRRGTRASTGGKTCGSPCSRGQRASWTSPATSPCSGRRPKRRRCRRRASSSAPRCSSPAMPSAARRRSGWPSPPTARRPSEAAGIAAANG